MYLVCWFIDSHRKINITNIIFFYSGIYIPSGKKGVKADFYGIGIRIEDNVLITDSHPVVLSSKCPKKIETIEALMKR